MNIHQPDQTLALSLKHNFQYLISANNNYDDHHHHQVADASSLALVLLASIDDDDDDSITYCPFHARRSSPSLRFSFQCVSANQSAWKGFSLRPSARQQSALVFKQTPPFSVPNRRCKARTTIPNRLAWRLCFFGADRLDLNGQEFSADTINQLTVRDYYRSETLILFLAGEDQSL